MVKICLQKSGILYLQEKNLCEKNCNTPVVQIARPAIEFSKQQQVPGLNKPADFCYTYVIVVLNRTVFDSY